jgi:hypothetical protein
VINTGSWNYATELSFGLFCHSIAQPAPFTRILNVIDELLIQTPKP